MVEAHEMGTSWEITKLLLGLICCRSSARYRGRLLKFDIWGPNQTPNKVLSVICDIFISLC